MRDGRLFWSAAILSAAGLSVALGGCVGVAYPARPVLVLPARVIYVQPQRYSIPADVLFAFNSAALRPEADAALARILATMRSEIHAPRIRVEGNADSIGSNSYNQGLSLRRAQAVAQWLAAHGVPADAISAVGNGSTRPVAPNTRPDGSDNPQGRAFNRRVDLIATAG